MGIKGATTCQAAGSPRSQVDGSAVAFRTGVPAMDEQAAGTVPQPGCDASELDVPERRAEHHIDLERPGELEDAALACAPRVSAGGASSWGTPRDR